MWLTGPVAPRHVGSSQTRARTRVPCIGRQILNHCATREAPLSHFLIPQLVNSYGSDRNYKGPSGPSRSHMQEQKWNLLSQKGLIICMEVRTPASRLIKRETEAHCPSEFTWPTLASVIAVDRKLVLPFCCHHGHTLFSSSNDDFGTKHLWSETPYPR